MPDNRFRVPEDELYASAHVPSDEQVEEQSEPVAPPGGWAGGSLPWADGGSGDADGD